MKEKETTNEEKTGQNPEKKTNEHTGVYFSSHIKIYDPNTKEVLVQKRGDN